MVAVLARVYTASQEGMISKSTLPEKVEAEVVPTPFTPSVNANRRDTL